MLQHRLDLEYDLRKNYTPVNRPPAVRPQINLGPMVKRPAAMLQPLFQTYQNLRNRMDDTIGSFGSGAGGLQVNY